MSGIVVRKVLSDTLIITFEHRSEVLICLMVVFRMACVYTFRLCIGLNHMSSPVQIIIEKYRLYLNKIRSRCNCSCASVTMCLACSVAGT